MTYEYKNESLEKEYDNNKLAMKKMKEELLDLIKSGFSENIKIDLRVEKSSRLSRHDKDDIILHCKLTEPETFWTDVISFEYNINKKELVSLNTSSGGTNEVNPEKVLDTYQKMYTGIQNASAVLRDNPKALEYASDIVYYDEVLWKLSEQYTKEKQNFLSERTNELLKKVSVEKITSPEKIKEIIEKLNTENEVVLYAPRVEEFKRNLTEQGNLVVDVHRLYLSNNTENKVYYVNRGAGEERVKKSDLVKLISEYYNVEELLKVPNNVESNFFRGQKITKVTFDFNDIQEHITQKGLKDLHNELVQNGKVKKVGIQKP